MARGLPRDNLGQGLPSMDEPLRSVDVSRRQVTINAIAFTIENLKSITKTITIMDSSN